MGLFAFSGTAQAPVEAPTIAIESELEASNASIALKDATVMTRPQGQTEPLTVLLTSYNAVPEQTDGNPTVTASGAWTNPEVVAARSVDLKGTLPFGTVVAIERTVADSENCHYGAVEHLIGYRVIADSMHSRKRMQVDVLLDQNDTVAIRGKEINPSLALGMCSNVTVRVIGYIDIDEMPATQEELRQIVEGGSLALR